MRVRERMKSKQQRQQIRNHARTTFTSTTQRTHNTHYVRKACTPFVLIRVTATSPAASRSTANLPLVTHEPLDVKYAASESPAGDNAIHDTRHDTTAHPIPFVLMSVTATSPAASRS